MRAAELPSRHADAWRAATRHPFLDGVRTGTLPAQAFAAWLAQDYRFVSDLLPFQARLLARSDRSGQEVLAGGLVALVAELGWFERQAQERGLELSVPRGSVTAAYRDCLDELERGPSEVALLALWALERAYLEAWRSAAPGDADYREFVAHWTTPAFAGYVAALEAAADEALGPAHQRAAEAAFLAVARLERDFWAAGAP